MNVHFVQHEAFEAPGAYLEWAASRKYHTSFSKVYENQPLPEDVADIDLLVMMGGPQSPSTTKAECAYFDAAAEMALINKAISAGKAVVGVCLGAQLIGQALDADYEQSPEKEIGVLPIRLTEEGLQDEKLQHFGNALPVGHWHNDMPGLTPTCKILAESTGCPRQIIAYGPLVYGFQCHMEFTPEVVSLLIKEEEDYLNNNTVHQFVQKPGEIGTYDYTEMNNKLFVFLDKLMEAYRSGKTA